MVRNTIARRYIWRLVDIPTNQRLTKITSAKVSLQIQTNRLHISTFYWRLLADASKLSHLNRYLFYHQFIDGK
ncbi:MAG: hypothetical protein HWD58_04640 [Bacteroidota bacterium]|nr:MAG: hypothetical protein HWD58_04640 [Bacteroidota bacterium]